MPDVLAWLRDLPEPLVLLVAAAMITAEAGLLIGIVLPGASAALALGVVAHLGVVHPALAAVTASVAAVAGTQLAYLRDVGGELPVPQRLHAVRERAAGLVGRVGLPAVCLGQWLVGLRTLMPRLAARAGIRYGRFASVSVPTAAVWGATLVVLGYLGGTAYQAMCRWFGLGAVAIVVLVSAVGWGARVVIDRRPGRSWTCRTRHLWSCPPCPGTGTMTDVRGIVRFRHSDELWNEFPNLVAGVAYAQVLDWNRPIQHRIDHYTAIAAGRLATTSESEQPEIQAWRRAFSAMGLKPTQYRCAAESLLRRFRKDGALPSIHPLIDLCNAMSLAFAIPVAVFDIVQITGSLTVRQATGEETYLTFSATTEHPSPGEVVFADEAGHAHARRWTNRQSARSAVRDSTTAVLIVAEALHPTASADIPRLIGAISDELAATWSTSPSTAVLSRSAPEFVVGSPLARPSHTSRASSLLRATGPVGSTNMGWKQSRPVR